MSISFRYFLEKQITIAIDAMGGDYAPLEIIKGAILAAKDPALKIILTGKEKEIREILHAEGGCCGDLAIEVIDAPEDIPMDEKNPAKAVRRAKNSSVVVANRLVAEGKADAVVAAGHTGAATAASLFGLGRIDGFERPCICTVIPTIKSKMFLIDGGSNIETTPEQMVQSAIIGTILARILFKKANPSVGLLNVGEEEGIVLFETIDGTQYKAVLPVNAVEFYKAFDDGKPVQPIEFEIDADVIGPEPTDDFNEGYLGD